MTVPWSPIPCESTENGEQLVGLIVKFGSVDVDLDRAHPDRDPADDLTAPCRRSALTWAVERVDMRATRTTTTP